MTATINANTTSGVVVTSDTSGALALQTAGTTALTISSAQAISLTNALPIASGGTGSTTLAGANIATTNSSTQSITSINTFGFKNRIINGGMVINQRGYSATPTSDNVYTLDRWQVRLTQASKFSVAQGSASGNALAAGFNYCITATSASAYSVSGTDYFGIQTNIEGYNIADLQWGTASGKTVTLSFWVNSSLTGSFGGFLANATPNQFYPFTYTISSANTWEQKSITIPASVTGTWNSTNGQGLQVEFSLGAGATYTGTGSAWASSVILQPTGSTSVVGTSGATWSVTGVQLEVGTQATSFDFRDYGRELILCQRYCYQALGREAGSTLSDWGGVGATLSTTYQTTPIQLPVTMRSASGQSIFLTSVASNYYALNGSGSPLNATNVTLDTPSVRCPVIGVTVSSGLTAGQAGGLYTGNSSNKIFITSEL